MDMKNMEEDGRDGGKAPLVILPGLMCDSRMFFGQLEAFGATVIDGFYAGANRIESMVEYALSCMPPRVSLLGHSMGARIAIELYRRAPDRVARLALANTGSHAVRPGEADKRCALRDLGREHGSARLVDAWLAPMIGPHRRDDQRLVAMLRAMTIDAGIATYERQIEALLHRPDAASVLPTIACPTVAIAGRDDYWAPVAQHEEIARMIPHAHLRVIENAGHMAPAEAPEAFNDILRVWLSEPA